MVKKKRKGRHFFSDICSRCAYRGKCFSPSRLTSGLRSAFFLSKGYRIPQNEAMVQGKIRHEEFQKDIKSLEEYGVKRFKRDLYDGEIITLKEVKVCDSGLGLRGVIDVLKLRFDKANKTFNIVIQELKSFNSAWKKFVEQLLVYGLIFGSETCRFHFGDGSHTKSFFLYPRRLVGLKRNIDLELTILSSGKSQLFGFMKDNVVSEDFSGWLFALKGRLLKLRRFVSELSVGDWSLVPACSHCWGSKCPFYDRFCSKEEPKELKSKQRFFGKKKLLVKNSRRIRRNG